MELPLDDGIVFKVEQEEVTKFNVFVIRVKS